MGVISVISTNVFSVYSALLHAERQPVLSWMTFSFHLARSWLILKISLIFSAPAQTEEKFCVWNISLCSYFL